MNDAICVVVMMRRPIVSDEHLIGAFWTAARILLRQHHEGHHSVRVRDLHPFVILAVPTARRARSASTALANTAAPLSVTVWNRETRCSPPSHTAHLTPGQIHHIASVQIFSES